MSRWILALSLALFALSANAATVTTFTPTGLTNAPQQVKAVFDKAMNVRGAGNANIFNISCSPRVDGYARWQNATTWVYRVYGALPGGSKCTFELKSNVTAVGGEAITGQKSFEFQIDGPAIKTAYPGRWQRDNADQEQAVVIFPEVEIDESTLNLVHFAWRQSASETVSNRVAAELIGNDDPRKSAAVRAFRPNASHREIESALVFTPKQKFPRKAQAWLVWPAGLKAKDFDSTRQNPDFVVFNVTGGFRAVVSCPRKNENSGCNPRANISIDFTNLADLTSLSRIQLMDVADNSKVYNPVFDTRDGNETHYKRVTFKGPFKPNASYKLINLASVGDREARKLENAEFFNSAEGLIRTGEVPPIVAFNGDFGVLESQLPGEKGKLPLRIRRTEEKLAWYQKQAGAEGTGVGTSIQKITGEDFTKVIKWVGLVTKNDGNSSVFADAGSSSPAETVLKNLELDKEGKVADQVQGLELAGPGLNVVEVKSNFLGTYYSENGAPKPRYVSTAVLVTNMTAHLKVAKGRSLVWVTSLDKGEPVANAKVTIAACDTTKIWEGSTNAEGIAWVQNGSTPFDLEQAIESAPSCGEDGEFDYSNPFASGAFVIASKDDDFTFTHTSWNQGIETWRFGVNGYYGYYGGTNGFGENAVAHTVLDRTLYNQGEEVNMKHFLRKRNGLEFTAYAPSEIPDRVWITHTGSGQKYEVDFSDFRRETQSGLSAWAIPKSAKLGSYSIQLVRGSNENPETYYTGSFSVEEYKLPLMDATVKIADGTGSFVAATELETQLGLFYMNGGPAKNKDVTFRYYFTRHYVDLYDKFPGYTFDPNKKELGEFGPDDNYRGEDIPSDTVEKGVTLDDKGGAVVKMDGLPSVSAPYDVRAEIAYFDPSGKTLTATASATVWSADRMIGIAFPDGYQHSNNFKFDVVVVDRKGKPVEGVQISPELIDEKRNAVPTRVLGGVYMNDIYTEVFKVNDAKFDCGSATTNERGVIRCSVAAPESVTGSVYIQVNAQDSKGAAITGKANTYVGGYSEHIASEVQNRMDLYFNKEEYNPELNKADKVAQVEVGMPFSQATALVTVEGEGVYDAKVVSLKGEKPVVNVDVDRKYAPGVYVSVMAVRGRVSLPTKAGEIDRGKPAFRMGLKKLNVASASNSLDIEVAANKGADYVFEAGEEIEMTATVKTPSGALVKSGELAIAVIDEALLSMAGNPTWDLLSKMLQDKPLRVNTSTASNYIIGARHFGSKAVAPGGGGAAEGARFASQMPTRDNFVPMVSFQPRVEVKNGKATFKFKANDALSTFRVVAVGQQDLDRFGMGYTTYRTNKDVILNSGLTRAIRTDDRFKGEFQVRNTTDGSTTVAVGGTVTFIMEDGSEVPVQLGEQILSVEAQDATAFAFDGLQLKEGAIAARYKLYATNADGKKDAVNFYQRISESVTPAVQSMDFGAVGSAEGDFSGVKVGLAETAVPGKGGVNVTLSANPLGDMKNVARSMNQYPYMKSYGFKAALAVVNNDRDAWDATMAEMPSYMGDNKLLKPYAKANWTSADLTVFVLNVAKAKGWPLPEFEEAQMLTGLRDYAISGFEAERETVYAEVVLRERIAALDAIANNASYQAASAGVQAYALPQEALDLVPAQLSQVTAAKVPTTTLFKWYNLIVNAGDRLANASAVKEQLIAEMNLRTVLNGRETEFREGDSAGMNAAWYDRASRQATGALAYLGHAELQKAIAGVNAEGIMVGLLSQQKGRGWWYGYRANAWGAVAAESYKKQAGGEVFGTTSVAFGAFNDQAKWFELSANEASFNISWAEAQATQGDVVIEHNGDGKPWAFVSTVAAVPVLENRFNGIVIDKKVEPFETAVAGKISRTDIAKVTLTLRPDTDIENVSVYDPIPAGARIMSPSVGFFGYYSEARADAFVANVPRVSRDGGVTLTYMIEYTAIGNFSVPGTRAEAAFAPEIFGEWANDRVVIEDLAK